MMSSWRCYLLTPLIICFYVVVSSFLVLCASAVFNIDILEKEKHAIVFESEPIRREDGALLTGSEMLDADLNNRPHLAVKNKFGREFACFLPNAPEPQIEPEMTEQSGNVEQARPREDVVELLENIGAGRDDESLFPRQDCYYYSNNAEWWAYELCVNKEVHQFHYAEKMSGKKQISILGKFSEDYDWAGNRTADTPSFMKYSKERVHVQYYNGGSTCDITGKPRTAEIHYHCAENSLTTRIMSIQEPSTCNYEIHVHTNAICSHAAFQSEDLRAEKNSNTPGLDTVCYKVLSAEEYQHHLAEKERQRLARIQREEEKAHILADLQARASNSLTAASNSIFDDAFGLGKDSLQVIDLGEQGFDSEGLKKSIKDVFSKLVSKEMDKMKDDLSHDQELSEPESQIKTNLDQPVGKEHETREDYGDIPDQLRELKKDVVANLREQGVLGEGEPMQEIKIKIMNVDQNGNMIEGDAAPGEVPRFTSGQLKQIKEALMGAMVKETPENGAEAQGEFALNTDLYNDIPGEVAAPSQDDRTLYVGDSEPQYTSETGEDSPEATDRNEHDEL